MRAIERESDCENLNGKYGEVCVFSLLNSSMRKQTFRLFNTDNTHTSTLLSQPNYA